MAKKPKAKKASPAAGPNAASVEEVDAFMRALKHPMKPELESLRRLILGVSPKITEGIKWNSPSFRTTEWFATANIDARQKPAVIRLILHFGAKTKAGTAAALDIKDPSKILMWLGKDRAMVLFGDAEEFKTLAPALRAVLKQWIKYV